MLGAVNTCDLDNLHVEGLCIIVNLEKAGVPEVWWGRVIDFDREASRPRVVAVIEGGRFQCHPDTEMPMFTHLRRGEKVAERHHVYPATPSFIRLWNERLKAEHDLKDARSIIENMRMNHPETTNALTQGTPFAE